MKTGSTRWLVGAGGLIVVLVVVSIVIALVGPGRQPADYPAGSPEGVVQRYLQAIEAKDYEVALGYLSQQARTSCTVQDVINQTQWYQSSSNERRIELTGTRDLSADRVLVTARVTQTSVSAPFDVSGYSYDQSLTVVREDGSWVLEYPAWPVTWCQGMQTKSGAQ